MGQMHVRYEGCSLSMVAALLETSDQDADQFFSKLCGLDPEMGRQAIEAFRSNVARDTKWQDALSQVTHEHLQTDPASVMTLLTDGFGLCELDALDVLIRLTKAPPAPLN